MRLVASCVLAWLISAVPAAAQRISAELETSQLSIANGVAEATFTVVVRNEEDQPLTNVWLVFQDGFEVAVGDLGAEASGSSEPATRSFDLSAQGETLSVRYDATLKYSVGGNAVEQATFVVLRLGQ
jgi:hypothetical protein